MNQLTEAETWLDSALATVEIDSIDVKNRVTLALGEIQLKRGNFHSADLVLKPLAETVEGEPEAADLMALRAQVLRCQVKTRMGEFDGAIELCEAALSRTQGRFGWDHPLVGDAQHYQGLAYHEAGELLQALTAYTLAAETRTRVHGKYSRQVAATYNNTGNVFWRLGLLNRALETHEAALQIKLEILGADHPDLAVSHSNLANLHVQLRDTSRAESLFLEALRLYALSEANPLFLAKAQDNYGELLMSGGRTDLARTHLEAANRAFHQLLPSGHGSIGVSEVHLGTLDVHSGKEGGLERIRAGTSDMLRSGRPDAAYEIGSLAQLLYQADLSEQADSTIEFASQLIRSRFGPDHPGLARLLNIRAKELIRKGDSSEAMGLLEQSIAHQLGWSALPTSDVVTSRSRASDGEFATSVLLWCQAVGDTIRRGSVGDTTLSEVSRYLRAIIRLLELEATFAEALSGQGPETPLATVLPAVLELQSTIYSVAPTRSSLDLIFRYSEMALAGDLHTMSARSEASEFAHLPPALAARERRLIQGLGLANREVAAWRSTGQGAVPHSLMQNLYSHQDSLSELVSVLHAGYPRYHSMRFGFTTASISQIQAQLGIDRELVQYQVAGDSLFATVIRQAGVSRSNLGAITMTEELVGDYLESLRQSDYARSEPLARSLFTRLIAPLDLQSTSRLIVIPVGTLLDLPFESLINGESEQPSRFLVQQRAISYHYSATLFARSPASPEAVPSPTLVVAPVFSGGLTLPAELLAQSPAQQTITFPELRGTGREAVALDHLFDRYRSRSAEPAQVMLGSRASESALKSTDLTAFRYVHLATHGYTNPEEPSLSGLIFEPGDGEDGVLHVGEVLGLELNADMVVLSACRTGVTSRGAGNGLMGLSRAFMYAGTNTVVASLWNSDDDYTAATMAHFYENLLQGQDKAEALRQAKLTLMEDPRVANQPGLWAPFVLIGES
ncbi:MAG: CHAT domain-containing protein [Rhodothermales bacterium]|nr:CHAT domain-containing protein [Rhodothermales bacterium]